MTLSNEHTRIVSVKFYLVKINLPLAVIGIKLSPQMDVTLAFVSSSQGTLGTGCIGGMDTACGVAPEACGARKGTASTAPSTPWCAAPPERRGGETHYCPECARSSWQSPPCRRTTWVERGNQRLQEREKKGFASLLLSQNILLVRENSWKFLTVGYVQLIQDALRPARHLPVTGTALQDLGGHEVPAVPVQDPPDDLVPSSAIQPALTSRAGQVVCPHLIRQPQEEWALEEGVSCGGWLGVDGPGSWREPPHAMVLEDKLPASCPPEESPAHPLLLLYRQRQPPGLRQ